MFAFYEASLDRFRPEHEIDVVCSSEPRSIPSLYFGDRAFNDWLSRELKPAHEEWSGLRLESTACYGIRVYQRGTLLHLHVDRPTTHVISSTICVDHRLLSPWPLHIEDVDGRPSQVDLAPGELLFYEGSRLPHGRPYPLDGDYYAAIFVHYRPVDR
jgi:prolyl 4-hydroxylase